MEHYIDNGFRKITIVRISILLSILLIIIRYVIFSLNIAEISTPTTNHSPIWESISFTFENKLIPFILSTIVILAIGITSSIVYKEYIIIKSYSSLFTFFCLLTFSLHPIFYLISPQLIALALIYLSFIPILNSYKREESQYFALQTGTFMAMASMFDLYTIALMPIVWHFSTKMRGFSKQALFAHILGYVIIYSVSFSLLLFFDKESQFIDAFKQLMEFKRVNMDNISVMQIATLVLSIVSIAVVLTTKKIQEKQSKVFIRIINSFASKMVIYSIILQVLFFTTNASLFSFIIAYSVAYIVTYTLAIFLHQRNIRGVLFISFICIVSSSLFLMFFLIN